MPIPNLDPERKCTHKVIDNAIQQSVYSGSKQDCEDFITTQEDAWCAGMYSVVEIVRPNS